MQFNRPQSLSFIDLLTRNLLLLTVMCICIGLGAVVNFLNLESLDTYFIQIKSDRLDFIFFIGVAACYIPLLFILIEKYWINFFSQLLTTILLFIVLIFIFNPNLKVKIYLFDYHGEFATRSWYKVKELPIDKMVSFHWVQMPNKEDQLFPQGVICPVSYSRYLLNFVFTSYAVLPEKNYRDQQGKMGVKCNKATNDAKQIWSSREQALLAENYQYFLMLDNNVMDESVYQQSLAVSMDQLPMSLQELIGKYDKTAEIPTENMIIKSSFLKKVLKAGKK